MTTKEKVLQIVSDDKAAVSAKKAMFIELMNNTTPGAIADQIFSYTKTLADLIAHLTEIENKISLIDDSEMPTEEPIV